MIPCFVNKVLLVIEMARPEKPRTPLGQRLIDVRKTLNHEVRKSFAQLLEIHVETLGSYERGISEPNMQFLAIYRDRFGVDLNWLVTGEGEMFADPSKAPARSAPPLDEELMKTLAKLAIRVHAEEKLVLRGENIAIEAAALYNELAEKADSLADPAEVKVLLDWIEFRLRKRLAAQKADPKTVSSKRA